MRLLLAAAILGGAVYWWMPGYKKICYPNATCAIESLTVEWYEEHSGTGEARWHPGASSR